jgi:microcompartment protein CcmK/EutM
LFGSKQAELSAEDWLHELVAIDDLPASTREWRLLTVKVAARMANRVRCFPD